MTATPLSALYSNFGRARCLTIIGTEGVASDGTQGGASLLTAHPHLAPDVERIVLALSSGMTPNTGDDGRRIQEIARDLAGELSSFDVLDLSIPRASPWRYRSGSEDTWTRLRQAITPTVEAMQQLVAVGRPGAALTVLQGVLLGLYTLEEDGHGGELLQAAQEFPAETAAWVWDVWLKSTRGRPALPERFLREHVPQWEWLRQTPKASKEPRVRRR